MSQAYQDLARREKAIADDLGNNAHDAAIGILSKTLVATSKVVVARLMKDNGGGSISEPAQDLNDLRTDPMLNQAKDHDLRNAETMCNKLMLSALHDGYEYDATERAKIVVAESTGLEIKVELSKQELEDLNSFPVQGLTCREWAAKSRYTLNLGIDQALAKPFTGAIDIAALPGALMAVAESNAASLQSLVHEAYFAGGKAAMLALRGALSGN